MILEVVVKGLLNIPVDKNILLGFFLLFFKVRIKKEKAKHDA